MSEEHTSTGLRGVASQEVLQTWKEANVATQIWKRDLVSEQPRSSITTKILKCPVNQLSDSGRNLKVMDLMETIVGKEELRERNREIESKKLLLYFLVLSY